jgi:hypothetical protein
MATRRAIKAAYNIEGFREGAIFTADTIEQELASVKVSDVPASTTDAQNTSLPLKQYCIKGAFNAALTGKFVNTEMIKYVFYRGCRYLDFEVFSFDGVPYVAASTDNTYSTIDTTNKITLSEILSTVNTYAFSAPSSIQKDPVFVNLRIKTNQTDLYNSIAKIIENTIKPKMYVDKSGDAIKVDGDTILSAISRKIIVVVDKSYIINENYEKLAKLANIESGYEKFRKYGYSEISSQQYTTPFINKNNKNGITTDVSIIKIVMPDIGINWLGLSRNNIYYPMVLNYGVQIVLYPFYKVDLYLGDYEKAFASSKDKPGAGFVPIGSMITYLKGELGGDSSVSLDSTTPAAVPTPGAKSSGSTAKK